MSTIGNAKLYLEDTFLEEVHINKLNRKLKLPAYLKYNFDFYNMNYGNVEYLLIEFSSGEVEQNSKTLVQVEEIKRITEIEDIILVIPEITNYFSKVLIKKKYNFIVPGKQIYLPSMAFVINEVQLTKYKSDYSYKSLDLPKFSPTTQGVLFSLMTRRESNWSLRTLAKFLNLSTMSISRAVKILKELDILLDSNRNIHTDMEITLLLENHQILDKFDESFINPIKKVVTISKKLLDPIVRKKMILSGQTVLSKYTMLGDSEYKTYAISSKDWIEPMSNFDEISYDSKDIINIEVWKHAVITEDENCTTEKIEANIHPVELYVAMKKNNEEDARIDISLNDLLEFRIYKGENEE